MAKRFTDSEKWKKRLLKNLPSEYKLLWLYILDDCNHAGIWEVDMEVASIRLGCDLNEEQAIKHLKDKIVVFDDGYKWFIQEFIDFQYGELNPKNRPHKSVIETLEKYNLQQGASKELARGIESPSKHPSEGCKDKATAKDKDKDKEIKGGVGEKQTTPPALSKFNPQLNEPSVLDIQTEADKIAYAMSDEDAEKFIDYYRTIGWEKKTGVIRDWRPLVKRWKLEATNRKPNKKWDPKDPSTWEDNQ